MDVGIASRGNELILTGDQPAVLQAQHVLQKLYEEAAQDKPIDIEELKAAVRLSLSEEHAQKSTLKINTRIKVLQPRTITQTDYCEAINNNELVFGLGPAGTGKTYLAIAMAVSKMLAGEVDRIVLSRPAVEAGEKLGFLPGDMKDKVDPYLRPMYDALFDTLPPEDVAKRMASGQIEIAPLAFMRGRTLSNAFVVLDEAQNTTSVQMKMFLTRLGNNSRMVVTGDPSQIDLPPNTPSGLVEAEKLLAGIKGVAMIKFQHYDIVRSPIVSRIISAYEQANKQ